MSPRSALRGPLGEVVVVGRGTRTGGERSPVGGRADRETAGTVSSDGLAGAGAAPGRGSWDHIDRMGDPSTATASLGGDAGLDPGRRRQLREGPGGLSRVVGGASEGTPNLAGEKVELTPVSTNVRGSRPGPALGRPYAGPNLAFELPSGGRQGGLSGPLFRFQGCVRGVRPALQPSSNWRRASTSSRSMAAIASFSSP